MTNVLVIVDDNSVFVDKNSKIQGAPELTIFPQVKTEMLAM